MHKNKSEFNAQCYEILKRVPSGKVTTYKEIAHALHTKAYRAVGNAMANNKYLITIPCHRVVKSDGHIGGFAEGMHEKKRLLISEGIVINDDKIENFEKYLYRF